MVLGGHGRLRLGGPASVSSRLGAGHGPDSRSWRRPEGGSAWSRQCAPLTLVGSRRPIPAPREPARGGHVASSIPGGPAATKSRSCRLLVPASCMSSSAPLSCGCRENPAVPQKSGSATPLPEPRAARTSRKRKLLSPRKADSKCHSIMTQKWIIVLNTDARLPRLARAPSTLQNTDFAGHFLLASVKKSVSLDCAPRCVVRKRVFMPSDVVRRTRTDVAIVSLRAAAGLRSGEPAG